MLRLFPFEDQGHQEGDLQEGHHHVEDQGQETGIGEGRHQGHVHGEVLVLEDGHHHRGVDIHHLVDRGHLPLVEIEIGKGEDLLHPLRKEKKGQSMIAIHIVLAFVTIHHIDHHK